MPESELMVPPAALMAVGGSPERAPAAMKHNADALLNDRCRLKRMQEFHGAPHTGDPSCKEKPLD